MVGNPRRRASKRNAERRRALELLAASPDGCNERSYWRMGSRPISWLI